MKNKNIKQGAIFLANLNPVKGSEQAGYRPVMIVQNDILNKHLNTVIVAPITTNLRAKGLFTTFFIDKKLSKLNYDSIVLLFQMRTIDKSRLEKYIFTISTKDFSELKRQLTLVF